MPISPEILGEIVKTAAVLQTSPVGEFLKEVIDYITENPVLFVLYWSTLCALVDNGVDLAKNPSAGGKEFVGRALVNQVRFTIGEAIPLGVGLAAFAYGRGVQMPVGPDADILDTLRLGVEKYFVMVAAGVQTGLAMVPDVWKRPFAGIMVRASGGAVNLVAQRVETV